MVTNVRTQIVNNRNDSRIENRNFCVKIISFISILNSPYEFPKGFDVELILKLDENSDFIETEL